jgi:REP element-mobilizing transposase RayT
VGTIEYHIVWITEYHRDVLAMGPEELGGRTV